MQEIILDASQWNNKHDFYSSIFKALGSPEWHGESLDALNDTIRGDDINELKLPYEFVIKNTDSLPDELKEYLVKFTELIVDLKKQGIKIDIRV
jgi:RNAse (barnase) inhibitor barstar